MQEDVHDGYVEQILQIQSLDIMAQFSDGSEHGEQLVRKYHKTAEA